MDIGKYKESSIWASVKPILEQEKDNEIKIRLEAVIHADGQDYDVFRLMSFDVVRDYVTNMMDVIQVGIQVPLGDYQWLVHPKRDALEMTITKTYLKSVGDKEDKDKDKEKIKYKCIVDPSNPAHETSDIHNFSQQAINLADMVMVKFRLVDLKVEPLRVKMVQGSYRGIKPADLIKSVMIGESQKVKVDGKPAADGIDLVEPDKKEPSTQIVLPSGTFMFEVPTFIQERCGGVYKNSIGTYFQRYKKKALWFVYPLLDFERFEGSKERDVAVFYSAPPKIAGFVEKTWKVEGGKIEIIVGTEKNFRNTTAVTQLNDGVGFRFMDNNAFMKKPVKINGENEPEAMRANLNREVGFMERKDGLQYAPVIRDITSNVYHETAKVAHRQMGIVKFVWQNSDPDLLYPGMPMKYCFMQDNEPQELFGTILGVHGTTNNLATVAENARYVTHTIVSCAMGTPGLKDPKFKKEIAYVAPAPKSN